MAILVMFHMYCLHWNEDTNNRFRDRKYGIVSDDCFIG